MQKLAALEGAGSGHSCSPRAWRPWRRSPWRASREAGDGIVCPAALYGGTVHLLTDLLSRFGVEARASSKSTVQRKPDKALGESTRLLWFESPVNPVLRCVDIRALAAAAGRRRGVLSCLDNTFASPINQQPLALGVDLVMHSATKYWAGTATSPPASWPGRAALVNRDRARAAAARHRARSAARL